MSDFLFTTRRRAPGELRDALLRFLSPVAESCDEWHGEWGSLAVLRGPHDPSNVLVEADGRISVLIGEPMAWTVTEAPGSAMDADRRASIHRLLGNADAVAWDAVLDNTFAALSIDTATGAGAVVTDLFAWIPVYAAEGAGELVLGTQVDAVASAAGAADRIDPVSAADLLANETITWPYTLYEGVRQVPPASVRRFRAGAWDGAARTCWAPREETAFASPEDAAAALREALLEDLRLACDGHPLVGLLLSGGEDSRAVLGALPDGVRVRGFTFAESENREVRTARRVARAYGVEMVFRPRDPEHYLQWMPQLAGMSGTQNRYIDAHAYGFHEWLGIRELPLVLGGLSSDALLKADNVALWARRKLDRGEAPGTRPARVPPRAGIRAELLQAVAERRDAFTAWVAELRPESADEWSRIYPFTMRRYAANVHGNRRLMRIHEPFQSNAVVRIAAGVPQRWKLDRKLFRAAVRPFLRRSWWVPHTRNRMPYLPRGVEPVVRPALGLLRAARALATGAWGVEQESWPVWERLAARGAIARELDRFPVSASPVAAVFERAGAADAAVRAWPAVHQVAALQLAYLTRRGG